MKINIYRTFCHPTRNDDNILLIEISCGKYLDNLGTLYGIKRLVEPDSDYRKRLLEKAEKEIEILRQ